MIEKILNGYVIVFTILTMGVLLWFVYSMLVIDTRYYKKRKIMENKIMYYHNCEYIEFRTINGSSSRLQSFWFNGVKDNKSVEILGVEWDSETGAILDYGRLRSK